MESIKLLILAASSIMGIGIAARETQQKHQFQGNTFYAISDGTGHFYWTTTQPDAFWFFCVSGPAYCTIVTRGGFWPYKPQKDVVPTASQATSTSYFHSVYKSF